MKILKAEMLKYKVEMKTYYPDYIANLINTLIFFVGFFILLETNDKMIISKMVIGFMFWFFTNDVVSQMGASISEEKQIGTLEQIMLKPIKIERIIFFRTICWNLISLIIVSFLLFFLSTVLKIPLLFNVNILLPFLLTMLGLIGIGYLLATLTILYTKTASFGGIIQYLLLFFTGAVIPLESLPSFIRSFSSVIPLTQGIYLSQKIIEENLSIINVLIHKNFIYLLISSIFFFLFGLCTFKYQMKKAMYKGLNNQY